MKQVVIENLEAAINGLCARGELDAPAPGAISVERTRDPAHGDFACNVAMKLAKAASMRPRDLAEKIVAGLPPSDDIEKVEIAGPGFINFHLSGRVYWSQVEIIRDQGAAFGQSDAGRGRRVMVEFVSTNPTGPLHVGHGRGAAFGDALARILRAVGYDTHSEYYINDAGRQMDILALSVWLRYLEARGEAVEFPSNGYRGDYVRGIADGLRAAHGGDLPGAPGLFDGLPDDSEQHIDELIRRCKHCLGEHYPVVYHHALNAMVADIRQDLEEFGVVFQQWFSELSLEENGDIAASIRTLEDNGHIYERDGAKWFRSTAFGDEKDRVVVRANGANTYFASDIAYHYNKSERGFDHVINIFGADHHGYIKRIQASFEALGADPARLQFLLVQFAVLYRGEEKVSMSTRSGDFVTLRELRDEVGNDAARFFYVSRRSDQHMDFDIELAKSQSSDNPVYYVQYAHARICSVFRQFREKGLEAAGGGVPDYALLREPEEFELARALSRFPEVVELAAVRHEPHQVAYYLRDLANAFHAYYNAHPFLSDDAVRAARMGLIDATRIVIANGLALLGVSAPEKM